MVDRAKSFPIVMAGQDIVFTSKQFDDFINQLCKEQRDLCAEEAVTKEIGNPPFNYIDVDKDSILNAKQPEVFGLTESETE